MRTEMSCLYVWPATHVLKPTGNLSRSIQPVVSSSPRKTASTHLIGKAWRTISRAVLRIRHSGRCLFWSKQFMEVWLYCNALMKSCNKVLASRCRKRSIAASWNASTLHGHHRNAFSPAKSAKRLLAVTSGKCRLQYGAHLYTRKPLMKRQELKASAEGGSWDRYQAKLIHVLY